MTTTNIAWINEATKPTVDYWTAKHLIKQILALIPDDELDHFEFERRDNEDGSVTLADYDEDDYFTIGYAGADGKPVVTQRADAVEAAIKLEVVHRADVALWSERLAEDEEFRMATAKEMVADRLADVVAEDVVSGKVIYNVESGLIVDAEKATDDERSAAAAAFAQLIRQQHADALEGSSRGATVTHLRPTRETD